MKNFNENFGKYRTYDNIKSHKKQGFTLFLEDTSFEKPQEGGVQIDPSAVLGLIEQIKKQANAEEKIALCKRREKFLGLKLKSLYPDGISQELNNFN